MTTSSTAEFTINNIDNFSLLKEVITNYYNVFMQDRATILGTQYFFKEMKDIGNVSTYPPTSHPSPTTSFDPSNADCKNPKYFNYFINACLNCKISNVSNNLDPLLRFLNTSAVPTLNDNVLNNIQRNINIINVFIDVLEAYKSFIDNNPSTFKTSLNNIDTIYIVGEYSRSENDKNKGRNFGYINEVSRGINSGNVLILSIKSFYNTTAGAAPASSSSSSSPASSSSSSSSPASSSSSSPASSSSSSSSSSSAATTYNYIFDRNINNIVADTEYSYLLNTSGEYNNNKNIESLVKQSVYKSSDTQPVTKINNVPYVYNTDNQNNLDDRDKAIFKNFLYFLINMNKDNVRMQVNALYFYYNFVRLYVFIICSNLNICLNNLKSSSDSYNIIKLTSAIGDKMILESDNNMYKSFSDTSTLSLAGNKTGVVLNYDNVMEYINNKINSLLKELYNPSAPYDTISQIANTNITVKAIYDTPTNIKLDFKDSSLKTTLQSLLNNEVNKNILKNNYIISYKSKPYLINDININTSAGTEAYVIKIGARFPNKEGDVPIFDPEGYDYSTVYTPENLVFANNNVQIVKKSLFTLKAEYNYGKNSLYNINTDIRKSSTQINNQKNIYNYQNNKTVLLDNQIWAYNIIFITIVLLFFAINVVDAKKESKQMFAFSASIFIIILIIINYIVNVSYIKEDFENFTYKEGYKNKIIEGFVSSFSYTSDLINGTDDISYQGKKQSYLTGKIRNINLLFIDYFQKIIAILPMSESQDFYAELNSVVKLERMEKENIKDILAYKKSLGDSNIDIIKYETNNKKVYLTTLLAVLFIYTILYSLSLYLPDEYRSLIIFVGMLFGVILFSYYMIFGNTYVRTSSRHKYWGPVFNDKL